MKYKRILIAHATFLLFAIIGCEELTTTDLGNLVPKTVSEDTNLPHIAINGTLLHAETYGNPIDPMVVFLHGGPGSDYRNALQVKQLETNGFYVVFYDQRGSGLSKRHPRNSYGKSVMLDDLNGVIQFYKTSPDQKVFLFGHSWGAILAADYINEYPNQINGAILAEPGGFTWERIKKYIERTKKIELFSEATNDGVYVDQFFTGKENQHELLDYKLGVSSAFSYSEDNIEGIEGASPFWRYGAEAFGGLVDYAEKEGFDASDNLDQYPNKVLFLYSENNKAYGLEWAEEEAAAFPNKEIARIDGTGHELIFFGWNKVYPKVLEYLTAMTGE